MPETASSRSSSARLPTVTSRVMRGASAQRSVETSSGKTPRSATASVASSEATEGAPANDSSADSTSEAQPIAIDARMSPKRARLV